MLRNPLLKALLIVPALLLLAVPGFAQFKASLQGTIIDANRAVIKDAKVTIANQDTALTRSTVSSDEGYYRISQLPPGNYTVTVEAAGFKTSVSKDVQVKAEEPRGFDVTVQIGAVSEEVTVSASAEALQTENANTGDSISAREIARLPQTGRDPYELLRFTPGVFGDGSRGGAGGANNLPNQTSPGGSNSSIFQTENSVQVVANGQRQSANNFTIDGVSVNSLQYGGAAVITPNQESVQEISVLSSSYSAEDGRGAGAQVKVVSKSGTNQLHGTGFFKYQDPNWNAFNRYGGPNNAPPVRSNNKYRQFGGSLGAPIIKDKLFAFFSYEGLRSNDAGISSPTWVETSQFRQLVAAFHPNSVAAAVLTSPGVEPRIASVLTPTCALAGLTDGVDCLVVGNGLNIGSPFGAVGQYLPFTGPNANLVGGAQIGGGLDPTTPDIQFVTLRLPGTSKGNQYNGRFDYISGKNQLSYSAYFTLFNGLGADAGGRSRAQGDLNKQPFNQVQAISFIHTFTPTLLNEFRVNFTRFNFNQIATNQNVNFGIPRIEIEGYNFDRIRFGALQGSTTPAVFVENSYNIRDNVTKSLGNQTLRMGFDFTTEQNNNNLSGQARPIYSDHGLWNFANDAPIFEGIDVNPQTGGPANAQRYLRSKAYGAFFQDDWKVRSNLTINLGLRWEYFSPFADAKNGLSNITFGPGGVLSTATVGHVNSLITPTKRDFGPRIGFAWSPAKYNGETVFRGGAGLAFNRPDDVQFGNAAFNPPNYARFGLCCGTSGGTPGGDVFGSPFDGGAILYALGSSKAYNSYPANPALAFGIDPKTGGVCADVACTTDQPVEIYGGSPKFRDAYVYLYSVEMERRLPYNLIATVGYQGSVGHRLPRLVNQNFLQQPSNSFFAVYIPTSDTNSNFNSLNARLRRQFTHGVSFDLQYRFSKSIDQISNEGPGAVTNQTDPAHPQTEHGPSDFNATHYLNFVALYDLPFFRDKSTFKGKVLGGWQLNGIYTWHTGFPWTPVTGQLSSVAITSASTISPTRPTKLLRQPGTGNSNDTFINPLSNFPGLLLPWQPITVAGAPGFVQCSNPDPTTRPGYPYFDTCTPGPPGIGRNSFTGPSYLNFDMSVVKSFAIANRVLGEGASIELRGNFFNVFNKLNLQPFSFGTDNTRIESPLFGRSPGGLSGRVIEFQARLTF